jgi:hypothetical protein
MSGVPPRPRGRKRRSSRAAKPATPPVTEAVDPVVHTPVLRPPPRPAPPSALPPELRPSREEDSADCIRLAFDKTVSGFLEHVEQGQAQQALLLGQNTRVVAQANADLLRLQRVFLHMLPPGGSHGR